MLARTRTVHGEYFYTRYHTASNMDLPRPYSRHYLTTHTHTPTIQCLLPNTRHFKARRPTQRTYAAPLLLQGKGKHSYKLHNPQPDYTVSRQHERQTYTTSPQTTWQTH
jgi:hypothetical protein